MKLKYILITFIILLNSCTLFRRVDDGVKDVDSNVLESGIRELAYDVLDNPDKLMDFKRNYPQFYDSLLTFSYMLDTSILNNMAKQIKINLKSGIFGYCMIEHYSICPQFEIRNLFDFNEKDNIYIDPTMEKVMRYTLWGRNKKGLYIYFVQRGSKSSIIDFRYAEVTPID